MSVTICNNFPIFDMFRILHYIVWAHRHTHPGMLWHSQWLKTVRFESAGFKPSSTIHQLCDFGQINVNLFPYLLTETNNSTYLRIYCEDKARHCLSSAVLEHGPCSRNVSIFLNSIIGMHIETCAVPGLVSHQPLLKSGLWMLFGDTCRRTTG